MDPDGDPQALQIQEAALCLPDWEMLVLGLSVFLCVEAVSFLLAQS